MLQEKPSGLAKMSLQCLISGIAANGVVLPLYPPAGLITILSFLGVELYNFKKLCFPEIIGIICKMFVSHYSFF